MKRIGPRREAALAAWLVALVALQIHCLPTDYLGFDPSAGPRPDAGAELDAEPDVVVTVPPDTGPPCTPPSGPLTYREAAPRQSACSASEVNALAVCLESAEKGPTTATPLARCFETASAACQACAVTPMSAALWGAFVTYEAGIVRPNVGGCVERSVAAAVRCSELVGKAEQCVHARACACSLRLGCRSEAVVNACATEAAARDACLAPLFSNNAVRELYLKCVPTADRAYFRTQLSLFCGP